MKIRFCRPTFWIPVLCWLLWHVPTSTAQTAEAFNRAETLIRQGQLDQGIALISQILVQRPQDPQAHNLMGIALTGKGDLPAANKEYRKALRNNPTFVPALKNLAINEVTENKVDAALLHFKAALKLSAQDPVIHAYLGKIAYSRHDYPTTAAHLARAGPLQKDPTVASLLIESELQMGEPQKAREVLRNLDSGTLTPQWQFRIGLVLAQHGLFPEALPFFSEVHDKDPNSYDAAFNLAVCLLEARRLAPAIEILRGLSGHEHTTAEMNVLLAQAYESSGQTQQAIDALREAIRLAPEDESSYVTLAALCTKYESYDLGLEIIQAGLHYHPQSDKLIFQRGAIHAMLSQFDLAEQDFQLASQLSPENSLSSTALGISYMQAGDFTKAVQSLRKQTTEKPADATLQFFFGQALIRAGAAPGDPAFAEAKTALETSVKLNPKIADSQVELAKLYMKENRLDEAELHLQQARSLDPKNKAACSSLVIVYRRKGKAELLNSTLATLNQLNEDERKGQPTERRLRVVGNDTQPDAAKP